MNRIHKFAALTVVGLILVLGLSNKKPDKNHKNPLSKSNMDLTTKPQDDFYQHINGGWMAAHPIPKEEGSYSTMTQLRDENREIVKKLVMDVSKKTYEKGTHKQLVSDFYSSAMDIETINKLGFKPIKPYLSDIDKMQTIADVQNQVARMQSIGFSTFFHFGATVDLRNSNSMIGSIWHTGTTLPDRDYYLQEGEYFDNVRAKYKELIKDIFVLCEYKEADAEKMAHTVYNIEYKLAEAMYPMVKLRDPNNIYHPGNIDTLKKLVPNFKWEEFFKTRGIATPEKINIAQPEFLVTVNQMLTDIPVDDWKTLFKWYVISRNSDYLSQDFVNRDFEFFGKVLRGTEEIRPRWKRMIETTSGVIGEAIGKIYVEKYFSEEAKEKMTELVPNLKEAMGVRIENLDWMTDVTKEKAQDKLKSMSFMIGYPDEWKAYEGLEISKETFFQNLMNARKWHVNESLAKIGKAVDKKEWPLNPQDVNAGYMGTRNQIIFPAGILQPPFFSVDADDALNYGAIGVVIGHEMTHGFDDKGRMYSKEGNLENWWQEEDSKNFEERAQVLIDQFNAFVVIDTIHANGKLTIGENIADLGGLNISYTAYNIARAKKKNDKVIDGFNCDQRFFISYAHLWAQNVRDEEKIRLTKQDVHSLGKFRVIGPLRNIPEFHEAFSIKEGDFMYLASNKRASIW